MSEPSVEITAWIDRHDDSGKHRIRLVLPNGVEMIGTEVYPDMAEAKQALGELATFLKADLRYAN